MKNVSFILWKKLRRTFWPTGYLHQRPEVMVSKLVHSLAHLEPEVIIGTRSGTWGLLCSFAHCRSFHYGTKTYVFPYRHIQVL